MTHQIQYNLSITERSIYTYLLNLSRNKSGLAFPRTQTIADTHKISLTMTCRVLNKLQAIGLIACKGVVKKLRFWQVKEEKKLCISKKKVIEYKESPTKIRQKRIQKKEQTKFLESKSLGLASRDLRLSNSIDVSSISTIVYKSSKSSLKSSDDFSAQKKEKKSEADLITEVRKKHGDSEVDAMLEKIKAKGYQVKTSLGLYLGKAIANKLEAQAKKAIDPEAEALKKENHMKAEKNYHALLKAKAEKAVTFSCKGSEVILCIDCYSYEGLNAYHEPNYFRANLNTILKNAGHEPIKWHL